MSQSTGILNKTFITATDMSTTDLRFVKMSADQTVELCGAGERAIGVRQDSPNGALTDTRVKVRVLGTTKVVCGDTVTIGAYVKADAAGAAVVTTTDTNEVCGIALEAGVVGDVIEILLVHGTFAG